jgi:hypothetical protein
MVLRPPRGGDGLTASHSIQQSPPAGATASLLEESSAPSPEPPGGRGIAESHPALPASLLERDLTALPDSRDHDCQHQQR